MTPERIRLAAYALVAGVLSALLALGIITAGQQDATMAVVVAVANLVAAVAAVVASRHVTADSWSTLRTGIYAVAAALLTAGGVYGLAVPDVLPWLDQALQLVGTLVMGLAAWHVPASTYSPEHAA